MQPWSLKLLFSVKTAGSQRRFYQNYSLSMNSKREASLPSSSGFSLWGKDLMKFFFFCLHSFPKNTIMKNREKLKVGSDTFDPIGL